MTAKQLLMMGLVCVLLFMFASHSYALSCDDAFTTQDPQLEHYLLASCINEFDSTPLVNEVDIEQDFSPPTSEELEQGFTEYLFSLEQNEEVVIKPTSSEFIQSEEVSSLTWIWFVGGALVLLAIFIMLVIKRVEHSENAYRQQRVQLQTYISDLKDKGYSDTVICSTLRKQGYSSTQIASFFK